jgi:hypothetical protein
MHVYLGQLVTTGMQIAATIYMVKKIDSDQEGAFLVPLDGGHGGWYSFGSLFPVNAAQKAYSNI